MLIVSQICGINQQLVHFLLTSVMYEAVSDSRSSTLLCHKWPAGKLQKLTSTFALWFLSSLGNEMTFNDLLIV